MNYHILLLALIVGSSLDAQQYYPWVVIGAGPAGLVSVAQLLEHGVSDDDIVWIDPEFSSGRIGKYYGNVPGNQKAGQFVSFLEESSIFSAFSSPAVDAIKAYDPLLEYPLRLAADVVIDLTQYLCTRVAWQQDTVQCLWSDQGLWWLRLNDGVICAQKVILATGSHPKRFYYEGVQEIPLDIALDETKLQKLVTHDDTVMVVGSAHSAFLILKFLYDFGVKKIINIYNQEPRVGGVGGLMGITAYWVQNVMLNNPSPMLERVLFDPKTMEEYVSMCSKVVYAFGYEPNEIPVNGVARLSYDLDTGIIEKNLYGIGIAFPQPHIAEDGVRVELIGFNSFMYRAKTCMPFWLQDVADEKVVLSSQLVRTHKVQENEQHASCLAAAASEWAGRWI